MTDFFTRLGLSPDHPSVKSFNYLKYLEDTGVSVSNDAMRLSRCGFLLATMAAHAEVMTIEAAKIWLGPIIAGTNAGNLSEEALRDRFEAIAFAIKGAPKFLFSEDLQRTVLRKFSWMPTPAEIWSLVEPHCDAFDGVRYRLNRFLGRPPLAALPSPQEIAERGWGVVPSSEPVKLVTRAAVPWLATPREGCPQETA